jgi:hypothetical protein
MISSFRTGGENDALPGSTQQEETHRFCLYVVTLL